MTSNEELVQELNNLKAEMRQMQEMIGTLLNMVIELDDDDEEYGGPAIGGIDISRFNN